MPASSQLISLDHAKDWAKRLVKHGSFSSLAKAQAAVAVMLGHAHWHALTQHHAKPAVTPENEYVHMRDMDEAMTLLCAEVNRLYPGLNATQVIEMAREMDLFDASPAEVAYEVCEKEDKGYFKKEAIIMVMEAHQCAAKAPPGHILLRVALTQENTFALVLVTFEVYRRALQLPANPDGR